VKVEEEIHLSRAQIIEAIVDPGDLTAGLQSHLNACRRCHSAKSELERELERLGRLAADLVPVPSKRLVVPLEKQAPVRFKHWRALTGTVVTALALILLVWGSDVMRVAPIGDAGTRDLQIQEAEILLMEVNRLMADPLPQVYLEICAESEPVFHDGILEFIVPAMEDDSIPLTSRRKGVRQC